MSWCLIKEPDILPSITQPVGTTGRILSVYLFRSYDKDNSFLVLCTNLMCNLYIKVTSKRLPYKTPQLIVLLSFITTIINPFWDVKTDINSDPFLESFIIFVYTKWSSVWTNQKFYSVIQTNKIHKLNDTYILLYIKRGFDTW